MQKLKSIFLGEVIKSTGLSVIISLVAILIFGLINEFVVFNNLTMKIVNQIIKVVALFFGIIFNTREKLGLIKGLIVGIIYSIIMFLLFLLFGSILQGKNLVLDIIFSGLLGAVCGIISVNAKKKE